MSRPRILVTLDHTYKPVERLFINLAYLRAIEQAGGEPILVGRPDEKGILRALENVQGILLSGGDDITPEYYGQQARSCIGKCDPTERDRVELAMVKYARDKKLPILGICRGMQLLNVLYGGTLYQDIEHEMPSGKKHNYTKNADQTPAPRNNPAHEVFIEPASLLYTLIETDKLTVNSLHHQGIAQLGSGLRATALAPDGLIEAIELPAYPFFIGVQWHPEELSDESSQRIFSAFISASENTHNS